MRPKSQKMHYLASRQHCCKAVSGNPFFFFFFQFKIHNYEFLLPILASFITSFTNYWGGPGWGKQETNPPESPAKDQPRPTEPLGFRSHHKNACISGTVSALCLPLASLSLNRHLPKYTEPNDKTMANTIYCYCSHSARSHFFPELLKNLP